MKNSILAFIFLFLIFQCFSQKEGNIWYFGSAGIDFNSGTPQALTNSAMNTSETCATISDNNGDLLFYTNGGSLWSSIGAVWNRNHQIMPNGLLMDTAGCSSASQGCVIIPNPSNSNEYYLFTLDCVENQFSSNPSNRGLRYTKVNMTLDSGFGDVTEKGVMVMPIPLSSFGSAGYETVSAIPHSNGIDYWIIANRNGSICKILVSNSGISQWSCENFGTDQLTPSPVGNKIMVGNVLYNFNQSTGSFSDSIQLNGYCSSFSSNGKVLYTNDGNNILQYDLTSTNILASEIVITNIVSECPRLAPDGKIYFFGNSGQYLIGAINCPNNLGLSCDYYGGTILDLGPGKSKVYSVPNFLQNYFFKSNEDNQIVSSCSIYLWDVNGQTYNESGQYTTILNNNQGCDSIIKLNLTINQNTTSTQSQTALDSYTWPLNNQTYIQSGTYTATIPNAAGCDSVVTLNLTLNYTGITENSEAQILISPNPASDNVLLKVSEQFIGKNYLIYDNSGRKIMEGIISQKEMIIKIGAFDDGIYLIKVNNEIQNTFRIIKQ